jgi:hypothetical protein
MKSATNSKNSILFIVVMYSDSRCIISSKFIWMRKPRLSSPVDDLSVSKAMRAIMRFYFARCDWISHTKHLKRLSIAVSF